MEAGRRKEAELWKAVKVSNFLEKKTCRSLKGQVKKISEETILDSRGKNSDFSADYFVLSVLKYIFIIVANTRTFVCNI